MIPRRSVLAAGAAAAILSAAACSAPKDPSAQPAGGAPASGASRGVPTKPSSPVKLNILDVAGNLKLTQPMINNFKKEKTDFVSDITTETGGAPDLVGTLKPQVDTGNLKIDLVLTGTDGMSSGIVANLWTAVLKDYKTRVPNTANYLDKAVDSVKLGTDYGVLLVWTPSGPFIQYDPAKVANPPKTAQDVLTWAKANPNKMGYARPANSGVGRTWLQGLPYMLGDSDPQDPEKGWEKTWAFLKELGQYISSYPTGTGQAVTNMADGTWSMAPMTFGWDIEPRATGKTPPNLMTAALASTTYVSDSQFALVPRGLSPDKLSAVLALVNYMLDPAQNAAAYDNGYFYPGPAVKNASIDKAPQVSQDAIKKFNRDWYDKAIADTPVKTPLPAEKLVKAFDRWDREIGSGKTK